MVPLSKRIQSTQMLLFTSFSSYPDAVVQAAYRLQHVCQKVGLLERQKVLTSPWDGPVDAFEVFFSPPHHHVAVDLGGVYGESRPISSRSRDFYLDIFHLVNLVNIDYEK